jgi:ribosome-associated protein
MSHEPHDQPNGQPHPVAIGPDEAVTKEVGLPKRLRRAALAQDDVPPGAAGHRSEERIARARELAVACARIADENRGRDIQVLDLRPATSLVDFFVIVTAASRRQAQAIASEIDAEMKQRGEPKLGREGVEEGRWILIDYGDFVVHVFSDDARNYYALEQIWGDSAPVEWEEPGRARRAETPPGGTPGPEGDEG